MAQNLLTYHDFFPLEQNDVRLGFAQLIWVLSSETD